MSDARLSMPGTTLDYPNALVDSLITKQNATTRQNENKGTNVPAPLGKCINPTTNEPVTARGDNLIMPVPGSEQIMSIGPMDDVKVPPAPKKGDPLPLKVKRSGTCPLCGAHVPLSESKGAIGSHTVRTEPVPAPKTLSESLFEATDTGARVGSPEASQKLRATDIDGAFERGTVKVPVPGKNGRTKLEDAPATEENVRAALAYVKSRKPRKPESKREQSETVSALTRRLTAIMDAQTVRYDDASRTLVVVPDNGPVKRLKSMNGGKSRLSAPKAGAAVGGRGHGSMDGSALIKGHPLTPMAGPITTRHITDPTPQHPTVTNGVDTRKSSTEDTTFHTSEGTVRPDPQAITVPVTPDNRKPLTRTQRRNATRRRKAAELKAENARLRAQLATTQH